MAVRIAFGSVVKRFTDCRYFLAAVVLFFTEKMLPPQSIML
jgi:hypothetical protein